MSFSLPKTIKTIGFLCLLGLLSACGSNSSEKQQVNHYDFPDQSIGNMLLELYAIHTSTMDGDGNAVVPIEPEYYTDSKKESHTLTVAINPNKMDKKLFIFIDGYKANSKLNESDKYSINLDNDVNTDGASKEYSPMTKGTHKIVVAQFKNNVIDTKNITGLAQSDFQVL